MRNISTLCSMKNGDFSKFGSVFQSKVKSPFSIFSNGSKSVVSLSRLVQDPDRGNDHEGESKDGFNIYVNAESKSEKWLSEDTIFRLIYNVKLSRKSIGIGINELKSNPMLSQILRIQDEGKYKLKFNASRVVIDSSIAKSDTDEETGARM